MGSRARPRLSKAGPCVGFTADRRHRSRPRPRWRLAALVDPSIRVLARVLASNRKLDRLSIMAARDVLDRNGFKPGDQQCGEEGAPLNVTVTFVRPLERSE